MSTKKTETKITGNCYCGAVKLQASQKPKAVTYCHCDSCRRITGAPVAAFVAFTESSVTFVSNEKISVNSMPGVTRSFCNACGSHLMGQYDYLPDTVYLPLGILDQADEFPPQLHAHYGERLAWLHIDDDLQRFEASARSKLNES